MQTNQRLPILVLVSLLALGAGSSLAGEQAAGAPQTVEEAQALAAERNVPVLVDLFATLDVDVSHAAESRYYPEAIRYRVGIHDVFEQRLYRPVLRAAPWWGNVARGLQNGSIHRYLLYAMVALVVVLVVAL
jgi:hypothetical protein